MSEESHAKKREAAGRAHRLPLPGVVYDGPLDLLLDLICKQDIDIYDIPIGKDDGPVSGLRGGSETDRGRCGGRLHLRLFPLLIHIKSRV